ncbi:ABC transporter substrate-binding protein [Paenibacillus sp. V4I5]|uniref:ABC transporter substrate-binding protein n=1 Tax=Paenibacillus sp. V4I5 TaxID=3042306 RepID=UPI002792013A|nr:extracellular solute-binding protein [Paenibacillus sp. V4I5]MDQ0918838.1 ABC-type glycerol-3-phosphate transport system substrate-binding protein [Paenibacillus sp. V4I5]
MRIKDLSSRSINGSKYLIPKYIDWMKAGGSYNNHQYGLIDSAPSPYGIFYNKTLVQKLGLEDPYELQQKGQWNWEKFREFSKKATQDTNGDGKTDVWGITGAYGKVKAFAEQLVYTNKGAVDKDSSGAIKFSLNSENAIQALQYASDLFNVDKSIEQPIPEDASKEFVAGKGVMYAGFSWELGGLKDNMKGQELGYVFFPKGPKADKYVSYTPFGNMWMVSKYSKNAEVALHIMDEISLNEEGRKLSEQSWQQSYPNKESMDTRKQMDKSINYISYYGIPDGEKLFEGIVKDITEGKVSPATAVDKVKPQFEAKISKLLEESK